MRDRSRQDFSSSRIHRHRCRSRLHCAGAPNQGRRRRGFSRSTPQTLPLMTRIRVATRRLLTSARSFEPARSSGRPRQNLAMSRLRLFALVAVLAASCLFPFRSAMAYGNVAPACESTSVHVTDYNSWIGAGNVNDAPSTGSRQLCEMTTAIHITKHSQVFVRCSISRQTVIDSKLRLSLRPATVASRGRAGRCLRWTTHPTIRISPTIPTT